MKFLKRSGVSVAAAAILLSFFSAQAFADEGHALDILRQGLLGAGVGAISAGASGGKAGRGALIGAGTSIIGEAVFNLLTTSSAPRTVAVTNYPPVTYVPTGYDYANTTPSTGRHIIQRYDISGNLVSEQEVSD